MRKLVNSNRTLDGCLKISVLLGAVPELLLPVFNPLKPSSNFTYHVFQQSVPFYFSTTECIYRILMILRINIDHLSEHC